MRKIELFLRSEFWLHLTTMFVAMALLIQLALLSGIYLPNWFLFPLPVIIGTAWEILWKKLKQKPIDTTDIIGTVIGGTVAILILRFI